MLNAAFFCVIRLHVIALSVFMLSVIMPNVVAPFSNSAEA